MARFEREPSEFTEKLVSLNRVSKTVKGGRVMKLDRKSTRLNSSHPSSSRMPSSA